MDPSLKQANTYFIINLLQIIISFTAFVIITYILINIKLSNDILIYLTLDVIVTGFMINGIKTFIEDIKTPLM